MIQSVDVLIPLFNQYGVQRHFINSFYEALKRTH